MARRKALPEILALKRAVKAIQSAPSEKDARAIIRYLYDAFIENPAKSTKEHWKRQEAAQQPARAGDGG